MASKVPISFEFFPPQSDKGRASLVRTSNKLMSAGPEFFSVTYGAGGSTRDRTQAAVASLRDAGHEVAPHLSFGSDDQESIAALLEQYAAIGVRRVVALRGDLPSGMGARARIHYAKELVEFIRSRFGRQFHVEVAAYPEVHPDSVTPTDDVAHFAQKVNAGADSAITQYFYNADAYFDFRDRCVKAGVEIPIVPGVMPITNHDNLVRFSDNCGAEIPRWIRKRLEQLRDDEAGLREFGESVVTTMCERLLAGGAPGMHFYTLNQAAPCMTLCKNLGLG